jgi:hypothetical protein
MRTNLIDIRQSTGGHLVTKDPFVIGLSALWLTVPATVVNFWRAWDRLPVRLATHFDAEWRPNGWSSREDAMIFVLNVIVAVLVLITAGCLATRRWKPSGAWPLLIISYPVVAFIVWMLNSIVGRNL